MLVRGVFVFEEGNIVEYFDRIKCHESTDNHRRGNRLMQKNRTQSYGRKRHQKDKGAHFSSA